LVLSAALRAPGKQVKTENIQPTMARTGADLFREFCAVCHGVDAKGNGPAANAMKTRPSDLTQISRRNDNKFPALQVHRVVSGEDVVAAHGSRDMPTWGNTFKSISADPAYATMRVNVLVDYLQKIQK
jgi:mono/diheme cytochrome c family protein